MRPTLAISVAIATLASTALAADCNPSYNIASSTECYTNCNVKAGQKYVDGWTMDHTSPLFLDSLAIMCNKSGPNYGSFMTTAGICMTSCAGDDPELFNKEFASACAWWNEHKNDKCTAKTTTTTVKTTTTTAKTTAPTTTKDTTTTKYRTTTKTIAATKGDAAATATATVTSTAIATTTATTTITVTAHGAVTVTVTECPTSTPAVACQTGYLGVRNGKGPLGACCSHSDDCQESCLNGKCNAPIASTCYSGSRGKGRGDGYEGACCKNNDDCWNSCIKGKCNGSSLANCDVGFSGKKLGNGPQDACCLSQRDCKEDCVKGICN